MGLPPNGHRLCGKRSMHVDGGEDELRVVSGGPWLQGYWPKRVGLRISVMYIHHGHFVCAKKVSRTILLVPQKGLLALPSVTEWRLLGVGQLQDRVPAFISQGR